MMAGTVTIMMVGTSLHRGNHPFAIAVFCCRRPFHQLHQFRIIEVGNRRIIKAILPFSANPYASQVDFTLISVILHNGQFRLQIHPASPARKI